MNLTLTETALSREGLTLSKPTIIPIKERNKEYIKAVLERGQQQLDESIVITNLKLIDKADRHTKDHQGNTAKHNLTKALGHYEKAFNQTEGEDIFKYIFNAIEDAINWDTTRDGPLLDNELSAVANIHTSKAKDWRTGDVCMSA